MAKIFTAYAITMMGFATLLGSASAKSIAEAHADGETTSPTKLAQIDCDDLKQRLDDAKDEVTRVSTVCRQAFPNSASDEFKGCISLFGYNPKVAEYHRLQTLYSGSCGSNRDG